MRIGDRVVYKTTGQTYSYHGKRGVITAIHRRFESMTVRFDHDGRERVINTVNLELEENIMKNFKVGVKDAIAKLLAPFTGDSPKDAAVRKLGIGYALATEAEAAKKAAKAELVQLGVLKDDYATGSVLIFDSNRYTLEAKTAKASQRLDQSKLAAAMTAEGISLAKMNRIIAAATVDTKPSTTYKVEVK